MTDYRVNVAHLTYSPDGDTIWRTDRIPITLHKADERAASYTLGRVAAKMFHTSYVYADGWFQDHNGINVFKAHPSIVREGALSVDPEELRR